MKTFTKSGQLKIHMMSHTVERPFKCDICAKAFTTSTNLKKHLLTHTGGKPYACDLCDERFSQAHYLKAHMMMAHTGDSPHKGLECGKIHVQFVKRLLHR